MRARRFHGLKRPRIRQSWSKYNLYNLARLKAQDIQYPTMYQQKFKAKSMTRAYHGEQVRERQWLQMYRSTLQSVVPMDHKYLAAYDGSEQAEGRGSGKDARPSEIRYPAEKAAEKEFWDAEQKRTPYPQMVYAPIERRLDTAIFRALFASSARQARQFVIHGHVKVNGKKIQFPGYLLNPGDMFMVEKDKVMVATGAAKSTEQRRATRAEEKRRRKGLEEVEEAEKDVDDVKAAKDENAVEVQSAEKPPFEQDPDEATQARETYKKRLQKLLAEAKEIIQDEKRGSSAKRKQRLRAFQQDVKKAIAQANKVKAADEDANLSELVAKLRIADDPITAAPITARKPSTKARTQNPEEDEEEVALEEDEDAEEEEDDIEDLSPEDRDAAELAEIQRLIAEARDNPIDLEKPYGTPWRPRDYMSAFAFIPRYLEVNQNICAAVYLRHPVARPGLAEVPTPFPELTGQLAHSWYTRRGR